MPEPIPSSRPPFWKRFRRWFSVMALAVLVLAIYKTRPWEAGLQKVSAWPLLLGIGINLLGFIPLRALRWRVALHAPPAFIAIVAAMLEGFVAGAAIGFGAADAVRTARLRRSLNTFGRDFGSTMAERAAEVVALSLLLLTAAFLGTVGAWAFLLAGAVAIGYVVLIAAGSRAVRLLQRWPRLAEGLRALLDASTPSRVLAMVLLSMGGWACEVAILMLCLGAFGLPSDLGTGVLIVIGINVVIAIPGPPANLGTFEAGVVAALALRQVPRDAALAFAIAYHVLLSVPVMILGGLVFAIRELRSRRAQ